MNYSAYCIHDPPPKPEKSDHKESERGDRIGKTLTYTCKTGYEFVDEPVATATAAPATTTTTTTEAPITWSQYLGAEYYMGNTPGATWQQARDKCQVGLHINYFLF